MLKIPVAILIAVVTLLGGFYGGYKLGQNGTQASAASTTTGGTRGTGGGFGGGLAALCTAPSTSPSPGASGGAARGRGTTGTISYLASGTLTVHNATCNTDTKVTFDPTVIVRKTVVGTVADLQENQNVTITGQRQADGSVKATSITLVPAGTGRFFGGGGGGGGAATGG
ncbi:MAG TPA: hypothetical protein VET65_13500 [Candidatus Limnocylindrales bacterium]|nr:hypothetical protein [Candidatus Limnocylindrales bacterium]